MLFMVYPRCVCVFVVSAWFETSPAISMHALCNHGHDMGNVWMFVAGALANTRKYCTGRKVDAWSRRSLVLADWCVTHGVGVLQRDTTGRHPGFVQPQNLDLERWVVLWISANTLGPLERLDPTPMPWAQPSGSCPGTWPQPWRAGPALGNHP